MSLQSTTCLDAATWQARAAAHHDRVTPWISPRLARRQKGERHPVDDFLFQYYKYRPAQLALWHPGLGIQLESPTQVYLDHADYVVAGDKVELDTARFERRRNRVVRAVNVLESTSSRTPQFNCFGMHEWAMVYGLRQQDVRHEQLPLRVSPEQIVTTVDATGLRCTHFDAYRFFTPEAATKQNGLTRASQADHEQPGCLHAGMDLYRYAYDAGPFLPSELTADCFENARGARTLDMQASPYDVSRFGLQPIAVETTAGRAEYAARQQKLARNTAELRERLLEALRRLLDALPPATE